MAKRKPLSKKTRFEVFKRDKFTCQYCGRAMPDVTLEVDHIKPVSKGGTDDIMNLITACIDCNRGKGATELSDDSVIKKQQRQLEELAERKEQLEMMIEWRKELMGLKDFEVDNIIEAFNENLGEYHIIENDYVRNTIKKWIREFGFDEVLEAVEIVCIQYPLKSSHDFQNAFKKVGGICNNRKLQKKDRRYYYFNYANKAFQSRGHYSEAKLRLFIFECITTEEDFETLKSLLRLGTWSRFCDAVLDIYGYELRG